MTAFYNENDPFAAAWLRELIKQGLIAHGVVDERSIVDLRPSDLEGFTQCHFFAGIGVWSYALRRAGWPDTRPVWTASCPCQPFSDAGKGEGFADERHLWPHLHWLIAQCRPAIVLGEQVASKDGLAWLDLVQADLGNESYTSVAVDTCAAGVGAPHIRQRIYWVAHSAAVRWAPWARGILHRPSLAMDNAFGAGLEGQRGGHPAAIGYRQGSVRPASEAGQFGRVADPDQFLSGQGCAVDRGWDTRGDARARPRSGSCSDNCGPGPTNSHWRDADWLFCRDGKWRPVEPGTSPLAHGSLARVGRLRGYGNAINAIQAQVFIEAVMDIAP